MWRKVIAAILILTMPAAVSAGPLREAADKAGRELAAAQRGEETRSRSRFWTGIALLGAGGVLAALGSVEVFDDEDGPDDPEDADGSDDGEDSDGWGNKALLGGGIAAAAAGSVLLLTGRRKSGPEMSVRPHRVVVRHTIRF